MIFITLALAYFIGSIPFGLLLTRYAGVGDIRKVGSGNIGATNVMRTGHKGLGVMTLLLDGGKGCAAIILARHMHAGDFTPFAGLFAVLGHIFPVWLRGKGGKGVATSIGVFLGLDWTLGLIVCLLWLLAFLFMRVSSLASMFAIVYSPIAAYVVCDEITALLCLTLAVITIFTHRGNIMRLLQGTEHNFRKENP